MFCKRLGAQPSDRSFFMTVAPTEEQKLALKDESLRFLVLITYSSDADSLKSWLFSEDMRHET